LTHELSSLFRGGFQLIWFAPCAASCVRLSPLGELTFAAFGVRLRRDGLSLGWDVGI